MIRLSDLNIHMPGFRIEDLNLTVEQGCFFVLMGPTGAGKTLLLEALAGLVPVQSGGIFIGGNEASTLPPEKRGVGIVYQDYALFPHLTVLENIRYGLRFHRKNKSGEQERLDALVQQLDLENLLQRMPLTLSGGERQRTALARALAIDPAVLLLDEPLSALDPAFRQEIRDLLKRLHRSTGRTFLMVSHDFSEALSLADRAAVMYKGTIEQVDSIQNIYRRPRSGFVADFVGMKNIFAVTYERTLAHVGTLVIETGRPSSNSHGYIAIRPEDIVLSRKPLSSSIRNSFRGRVSGVFDRGAFYEVDCQCAGVTFRSLITQGALLELEIETGLELYLSFKATAIHTF